MVNRQPSRRVDQPQPGWFVLRLVRGGPLVPASIACNEDGIWTAVINGALCGPGHPNPELAAGVFRIWHGGMLVDKADHDFRLSLREWARAHDPVHPAANPSRAIDLSTRPSLY